MGVGRNIRKHGLDNLGPGTAVDGQKLTPSFYPEAFAEIVKNIDFFPYKAQGEWKVYRLLSKIIEKILR